MEVISEIDIGHEEVLPSWDNGFLTDLEHTLIGSSDPVFAHPDYYGKLGAGEEIPNLNTVGDVVAGEVTPEVAAKVRDAKKYINVGGIFGESSVVLSLEGYDAAIELPIPDQEGKIEPKWRVVLLTSGKLARFQKRLAELSLDPRRASFLSFSRSRRGAFLEYKPQK